MIEKTIVYYIMYAFFVPWHAMVEGKNKSEVVDDFTFRGIASVQGLVLNLLLPLILILLIFSPVFSALYSLMIYGVFFGVINLYFLWIAGTKKWEDFFYSTCQYWHQKGYKIPSYWFSFKKGNPRAVFNLFQLLSGWGGTLAFLILMLINLKN